MELQGLTKGMWNKKVPHDTYGIMRRAINPFEAYESVLFRYPSRDVPRPGTRSAAYTAEEGLMFV